MNWIDYVLEQRLDPSGHISSLSTIEQHLSTFCRMMAFDTDLWQQHVQLTLQEAHLAKVMLSMASLIYLQVYWTPIRWKWWWSGLLTWGHQQWAWKRPSVGSSNWLRKWLMHAQRILVKLERCGSGEARAVQDYDLCWIHVSYLKWIWSQYNSDCTLSNTITVEGT